MQNHYHNNQLKQAKRKQAFKSRRQMIARFIHYYTSSRSIASILLPRRKAEITNRPVINIKSSKALFMMRIGLFIGPWVIGPYEEQYTRFVASEAEDQCTSGGRPLSENAAVYVLAQSALRNQITIKGRTVNLKMDSVIDYKGGTANVCIETLQCMLFDSQDKTRISSLCLDQLRVYPALVHNLPMFGLQGCYLQHSKRIIDRVREVFNLHNIALPKPCKDYDPMSPEHVVRWLEEVLLANHVSPQYIEAAVNAVSAIGDLEPRTAKQWINDCIGRYTQAFASITARTNDQLGIANASQASFQVPHQEMASMKSNETNRNLNDKQIIQQQVEERVRRQLNDLLAEFNCRRLNQSVVLEVRGGHKP